MVFGIPRHGSRVLYITSLIYLVRSTGFDALKLVCVRALLDWLHDLR